MQHIDKDVHLCIWSTKSLCKTSYTRLVTQEALTQYAPLFNAVTHCEELAAATHYFQNPGLAEYLMVLVQKIWPPAADLSHMKGVERLETIILKYC